MTEKMDSLIADACYGRKTAGRTLEKDRFRLIYFEKTLKSTMIALRKMSEENERKL